MPTDPKSVILLVLLQSWDMLLGLWYYVVAGIIAGALATALIPKERLTRLFTARIGALLPVAAVSGMASPLCTYSTVPFFTGLLKRGMPIGPIAAFLVASASINPQLLVLTAGTLGLPIAIAQVVSIFVMAILVGTIAPSTGSMRKLDDITENVSADACNEPGSEKPKRGIWKEVSRNALGICEHISLYFIVGIIIANAVLVLTNGSFFSSALGPGHWYSVPLAGLCAVPLYACGGAAIPVLKVGAGNGMSEGAILAFLIAGPATRVTSLIGISTIFNRRAVIIYIAFVILFSVACGLGFDAVMRFAHLV